MKFPQASTRSPILASVLLAIGATLAAQPTDPVPLVMTMDGRPVSSDQARVVLLPSTNTRRLAVEFPASMPPSGPAIRTDAEGGTVYEMPLEARVRWSVSSGTAVPRGMTSIDIVPPDGGRPVTISATVEVDRTDAAGQELEPWRAQASIRMLPGMNFDRDGSGVIDDVVVGIYPNEFATDAPAIVRRTPDTYRPPRIFYRLDEVTSSLSLSEHLTMGALCPPVFDSESTTRYVAIDPRLPDFWEALRHQAASAGSNPNGLRILRGFVSPNERQRLERLGVQLASFTRYQYGDAIAVIHDENGDFRMDDLDGDGQVTLEDAAVLAGWARAAMTTASVSGGIGLEGSFEGPNHLGTPYLHVDLRGGGIVEWRTN
jgi:hypothetical protein